MPISISNFHCIRNVWSHPSFSAPFQMSLTYSDSLIPPQVYESAVEAIDHIFFIGVQEAYDLSVKILLREMNMTLDIDIQREREQGTSNQMKKRKEEIKRNATLLQRVREVNSYDIALYQKGTLL
jgi:hypothetical protein